MSLMFSDDGVADGKTKATTFLFCCEVGIKYLVKDICGNLTVFASSSCKYCSLCLLSIGAVPLKELTERIKGNHIVMMAKLWEDIWTDKGGGGNPVEQYRDLSAAFTVVAGIMFGDGAFLGVATYGHGEKGPKFLIITFGDGVLLSSVLYR